MNKNYWKSLEELKPVRNQQELFEHDQEKGSGLFNINKASRRDFLKLFGFSVSTAALAASCEKPVSKAIPYLIKPEELTPGKANYYATSYFDGDQYSSILVKTREGRPIKIEGNELSPVNGSSSNAIIQASLLGLYDTYRYKGPKINGKLVAWDEIDAEIGAGLKEIKEKGGRVALLSSTIISPTLNKAIAKFGSQFENFDHVVYDLDSAQGILEANKASFGRRVVPGYQFQKADYILSLGADFLGTWLSPVEYTRQYAQRRKLDAGQRNMSRHVQIETGMSLTGSNADYRLPVKQQEIKIIVAHVYQKLAEKLGMEISGIGLPVCTVDLEPIIDDLLASKGKSIIISNSNDVDTQMLINGINYLLGNYGNTIDLNNPLLTRQGDEVKLGELMEQMKNGEVDALLVYNVNPAFDLPVAEKFPEALEQVPLTISFASTIEETASKVKYICPDHHYLEAWADAMPTRGIYSLGQPAIHPLFNTRQFLSSLLKWTGEGQTDALAYLKNNCEENIYPVSGSKLVFRDFWNQGLHDGLVQLKTNDNVPPEISAVTINNAFQNLSFSQFEGTELSFYQKTGIGTGRNANNPWLQEMPDPVSKVCWDNYLNISPKQAGELGLENGDVVKIGDLEIPVLVQPGQAIGTVSLAIGYGRLVSGKSAKDVGVNANVLRKSTGAKGEYLEVKLEKTGKKSTLAMTQTNHSMEGRNLVRETKLENYLDDPASGNEEHEKIQQKLETMYDEVEFKGHHWGMAIDMNSCIGCSACLVACSVENNVPIVGKKEVARAHEMHWIRIDRYYTGKPDNPEVVRQPVMCQHCDNAPCENVCPVAATTHSNEGINQMAYNRCIGTRYCNNNCPYKVRRFNWFDYTKADAIPANTVDPLDMTLDLPRMVLNPDVTVRAKGVMEKCTFCVQRIQEKKLEAKLENRDIDDGELKTACQQVCPAEAIVFGDLNDENSKVSKMFKDPRNYHLLEELHTLPSVGYLTKVRNKKFKLVKYVRFTHQRAINTRKKDV